MKACYSDVSAIQIQIPNVSDYFTIRQLWTTTRLASIQITTVFLEFLNFSTKNIDQLFGYPSCSLVNAFYFCAAYHVRCDHLPSVPRSVERRFAETCRQHGSLPSSSLFHARICSLNGKRKRQVPITHCPRTYATDVRCKGKQLPKAVTMGDQRLCKHPDEKLGFQ